MAKKPIEQLCPELKRHRYKRTWVKKLSIHEGRRVAFIYVPKNATSTLRQLLGEMGFKNRVSFRGIEDLVRSCFLFTVLRNPLERYISAYLEAGKNFIRENKDLTDEEHWQRFLHMIPERGEGVWDEHLLPQYMHLIEQDNTSLDIDRFLLFESFEEGWEKLCREELGLPFKICHLRESPRKLKDYLLGRVRENRLIRKKINKYYEQD